ncbi:MAG: hypothetical protein KTR24_17555 [Saprospiraceae bacterium]|nr:hypothetical protein [Saprospiraceae bacterium]
MIQNPTSIRLNFTYALSRFYPNLRPMDVEATSLSEILDLITQQHAGFRDYIVDERGALRKHVNIFLDDALVQDRETLSDSLAGVKEIFIMQALSGG